MDLSYKIFTANAFQKKKAHSINSWQGVDIYFMGFVTPPSAFCTFLKNSVQIFMTNYQEQPQNKTSVLIENGRQLVY